MAKRKSTTKQSKEPADGQNGGIVSLTKELFQAAITLRGSIEPPDYKRYVLPIIFLQFLSLRYDRRRAELEVLVEDKKSDYFGDKKAIHDPEASALIGQWAAGAGPAASKMPPRIGSISEDCRGRQWRRRAAARTAVSTR